MLAAWPELAELILRTMMARREWHEEHGYGVLRLIAPRGSRRAFEVRDLLERNLIPVRWYDVDTDDESAAMLDWLQIPREETPVLVRKTAVLRNPSAAQVARELGLRAEIDGERFDLVVLGGGPAGLAAAVYGGSEGLRTLVAEAWAPGGQAGTSTRIENYLGFPTGISGTRADAQGDAAGAPLRRGAVELPPRGRARPRRRGPRPRRPRRRAARARAHGRGRHRCPLAHARGRQRRAVHGRRRLPRRHGDRRRALPRRGRDRGRAAATPPGRRRRTCRAWRAASASSSAATGLAATMSRYLLERIESRRNIEVLTGTEVSAVDGDGRLEHADLRSRADGSVERVAVSAVFVMIGADPCTEAVHMMLDLDEAGYIRCGGGAAAARGRTGGGRPAVSRTCSRPSGRASSPRATSAPGRRSAWPARSATAPWRCASPTRSCWPERHRGSAPPLRDCADDARGGRRGVVVRRSDGRRRRPCPRRRVIGSFDRRPHVGPAGRPRAGSAG